MTRTHVLLSRLRFSPLALVLLLPVLSLIGCSPQRTTPQVLEVASSATAPEVIVYVNSRCPYCSKAKAFMDQEGIEYEARDVRASARAKAEFQALGGSAVPLFIIGKSQVRGLDKIRVRELVQAARRRKDLK